LIFYSFGLSFVALVRVVVPAFYAMKDTRTPVLAALFAFMVNLAFSLALMGPMLHGGLALASTIAALGNLLVLLFFLRRKIGPFGGRGIMVCGVKAAIASLPVALVAWWGMTLADWVVTEGRLFKVLLMASTITAAALLYLGTAWGLKCGEARDLVGLVRKRLERSKL
jgi:putative peptidoglycan lipid II flippase